jgi:hypothetical protein
MSKVAIIDGKAVGYMGQMTHPERRAQPKKLPLFDRIFSFSFFRRPPMLADAVRCEHNHPLCLGPNVAANRGGCRMQTWADVG